MNKKVEIDNQIQRFSNFSKYWSSIALITLSTFLAVLGYLLQNYNTWYFKSIIVCMYLLTIVLTNLMAVNYLAMEKSARDQLEKLEPNLKLFSWKKVKIKPFFIKALKSWAIYVPLLLYFCYFIFLIFLAIY